MAMPTLLDIVKRNGTDAAVGLIEEAFRAHPEVRLGAARTISGVHYKTRVRTAFPTVGFRKANEGTAVAGSRFEQRLTECFIMNPPFEVDKAVADASEDGAMAYLAEEASGIMEGAMQALGACFYYGTHATLGRADAFPGLIQAYDNTNMVVDAGGTTGDTGSSVWAVRWGTQHTKWVLGKGGVADVTDPKEVRLTKNDKPYTGYHSELYMRPGLQIGSVFSVGRIKKITADSSKTLTDDMIASLLLKFPVGVVPDMLFMNRRSLGQLRSSRTATNATGAPAPFPTEAHGVPIEITDSIVSTESLTL